MIQIMEKQEKATRFGAGNRRGWFGQIMVVPEQYHGSFGPIHGTFKSWQFPGLGAPKQRLLPDRHTHTRPHSHTRRGEFREPKRLTSFEKNSFTATDRLGRWPLKRASHAYGIPKQVPYGPMQCH